MILASFQYPLGDRRFGKKFRKTFSSRRMILSVSSGGSKVWKTFVFMSSSEQKSSFSILWGIEGLEMSRRYQHDMRHLRFSILWGIEGLEIYTDLIICQAIHRFSILWGIEGLEMRWLKYPARYYKRFSILWGIEGLEICTKNCWRYGYNLFQYPLGDRRFGNVALIVVFFGQRGFQYPLGDRRFGNVVSSVSTATNCVFQYPLGDRRFGNQSKLCKWSRGWTFQYPLGDRRFGNFLILITPVILAIVSVSSGGSKVWKSLAGETMPTREQVSVSSGGSKVWKFRAFVAR